MGNEDKVVLITGATNGIGQVAAHRIAKQGYRMVLVGRDAARCGQTVDEVKRESGNSKVEGLLADLSIKSDVERLAKQFRERHDRLDVLINNAGAVFFDRRETPDGLERTFALNHMAYFLLTHHLLDLLKKSTPARVVNVSSVAHKRGTMAFDDLQLKSQWGGWAAYCQSKLANIHFTTELSRRLDGSGVTVNCLHPGVVSTNFGTDNGVVGWAIRTAFRFFGVTAEDGARTIVYLATSPEVAKTSGRYFYKDKEDEPSAEARDTAGAKRLWEASEKLAGLAS